MKKHKVIYIVIDGLAWREGRDCMGFLQGLCASGQAALYKVICELPSMSRPLYETLLTGKTPVQSGICSNDVCRLSHHDSVFSLAGRAGLVTAAAAFHWFSELYNRAPFSPERDRYTADETLNIRYGCFYHTENYPDSHLYLDAEHLRRRYDPDILFIHPMGVDYAGHQHGHDSPQYRNAARACDFHLSSLLQSWLAAGYQVLITADHGMTTDKMHGGNTAEEREVPLYVAGDAFSFDSAAEPLQTELAGTVCELLGLTAPSMSSCRMLLKHPLPEMV